MTQNLLSEMRWMPSKDEFHTSTQQSDSTP